MKTPLLYAIGALALVLLGAAPCRAQTAAPAAANVINAMSPATVAVSPAAAAAAAPAKPGASLGASAAAGRPKGPPAPPPEASAVDLHAPFKQSFFFTSEDIIQIKKAIEGQKVAATFTAAPIIIPPVRRIRLSGIIYKDPRTWIVWLNGQKVTPAVSLKEIEDIRVEDDIVHLKWFDIGANKVLNITLRPHQTYDIVTGVLLPGL